MKVRMRGMEEKVVGTEIRVYNASTVDIGDCFGGLEAPFQSKIVTDVCSMGIQISL